jgi:hypothetical protein
MPVNLGPIQLTLVGECRALVQSADCAASAREHLKRSPRAPPHDGQLIRHRVAAKASSLPRPESVVIARSEFSTPDKIGFLPARL